MASHTSQPKKPEPSVSKVPAESRTISDAMASGQSSWNTSGFAFAPNTNVQDRESMPSVEADAARHKADEVMAALRSGEPGAADRMMGEQKEHGTKGIVPLQWLTDKFRRGKNQEGENLKGDEVVR
nr:hypothetical protein CFP56_22549 [Quercus suber]